MRTVLTRTPLRISFFGGGTDLESFWSKYKGQVLSVSINRYIYVAVQKSVTPYYTLSYLDKCETVDTIDDIKHDIVRESLRLTGTDEKVSISIKSDVTSDGSGLGASSTLAVGILHALYRFKGKEISVEELARQACYLEIHILKQTIGKQDQYIAAYGGMQHISFLSDGTVELRRISNLAAIKNLESRLLLFHTGIGRKAGEILKEQNVLDESKANNLLLMASQVEAAVNLLEENKIDDIGKLLKDGWMLKKQLSKKISNVFIDELINRLFQAGAEGVKVTGAGGGGGILVFHKPGKANQIREAVKELEEYPFSFTMEGTQVLEAQY
ncbi:GHMP family kinase ATP-binding protein [Anaeromicropila populeti]|uniref:D-glycero-alpha-D-manno-heptose-7-phosphate kinase n=1 Tax=Anaeromicropila populeti TaxID=37658 RepID=A0A1I6L6F4_9FIRM|nr:hypothetical protein [Anaeromicropila populeti]SFR99063.1 D-glycero-alpha-D-manno-heptose-7-phosphate kinase [Anaeromicropila populeti]